MLIDLTCRVLICTPRVSFDTLQDLVAYLTELERVFQLLNRRRVPLFDLEVEGLTKSFLHELDNI